MTGVFVRKLSAGPFLLRAALVFTPLMLLAVSAYALWSSEQRLTNDSWDSYASSDRGVACDAYGNVHVVWHDNRDGNREIYHKVYDGVNWGPDERLTNCTGSSEYPSVVVDSSGEVHVVWEDGRDGNHQIYHKVFDGVTWGADERLTSSASESKRPSVAADGSGNLHVVWYDNRDGGFEIYYKRFDGINWGADERVTNNTGSSVFPSVGADCCGHVHVVWYDDRDGNNEIYYKTYDGVSWEADERLTNNAGSSAYPAVAVDSCGHVHVVWRDDRDGNNEIYYKTYDGVSWGADERLTNAKYDSSQPSLAVDGSGNVHVVWQDDRDGCYRIFYKLHDCAGWDLDRWLSTYCRYDSYGYFASVAVGGDGDLHVVWTDERDANPEIYYRRWFAPAHTVSSLTPIEAGNIFPVSAAVRGAGLVATPSVRLRRAGQPDIGAENVVLLSPSCITCDFDLCGAAAGIWHLFVKNPDGQEATLENALVVFNTPWGDEERVTNDVHLSSTSTNGARCVAREASGVVHTVWYDFMSGNFDIYYRMWDGGAWGGTARLTVDAGYSMNPSLALGAGSNLHLSWKDNRDGNWEIYYKSCDGGVWDGDQRLTNDVGASEYPSLTVDPVGNPLIVFQDSRAGNLEIYCVRRDGSGWLEERLTNDSAVSEYPAAASDSSGNTFVFWEDRRDGNSEIYSKIWNGLTWTPDMRLTSTEGTSTRPAAGCDNLGRVMVAWEEYEGSVAAIDAKLYEGSAWTDLGQVCPTGRTPNVCGDGQGRFVLVCQDSHDGKLAIFSKWYSTSWTAAARITAGSGLSEQPSVAADALGKAAVVWQDTRDKNQEIYARRWEGNVETSGVAALAADDPSLALEVIAPNPVTSTAEILLSVGSRSAGRLHIYDVTGRQVWIEGIEAGDPGLRRIIWNGRDLLGNTVSAGVYFVRLEMGRKASCAKMVVLK